MRIINIAIISSVFLSIQCRPSSEGMDCYRKTVESGITHLKWASDMEKWYAGKDQEVDHFITHYGFDKSKPVVWNSVVYLYGRYVVTLQVKIIVDYKNCKISKPVSPASLFVHEIRVIKVSPSGQISSRIGDQEVYSDKVWPLLEKSSGDLESLPMKIVKDDPLSDFNKFRDAWGKDIVR